MLRPLCRCDGLGILDGMGSMGKVGGMGFEMWFDEVCMAERGPGMGVFWLRVWKFCVGLLMGSGVGRGCCDG